MKRLVVAASVVAIGALGARSSVSAQDVQVQIGGARPAAPAGSLPATMTFEVASVKRNTSGENNIRFGLQPGGRFTATNVPARQLLIFAYQLQNFQLIDAPDWTLDERYDILAKAEGGPPRAPRPRAAAAPAPQSVVERCNCGPSWPSGRLRTSA